MKGHDYRVDKTLEQTPRQWAKEGATLLANGGRRRVEQGETFFHGADGRIAIEVYGNVVVDKRQKPE